LELSAQNGRRSEISMRVEGLVLDGVQASQRCLVRLVAQAEIVRFTQAFTDPSMRPRSPEVLLQRFRELNRSDIVVGGVLGARHYLPGLDLVGTPRLDLVVHTPRPDGSHEFLRKLDPALKPAKRGEPARVFVHTLWQRMLTGTHQDPGNAETPVDELPAVRLYRPGVDTESEEAWFIELLTVPESAEGVGNKWTHLAGIWRKKYFQIPLA
jgi:hypothetical protein